MKKLLSVLPIVILLAVGCNSSPQAPVQAPVQTQTVQNTNPTPDQTANWQAYTDSKFGYSIKYPQGYTLYKYDQPCQSNLDNKNGQNVVIWINSALADGKEYQTSQYQKDIKAAKIIDFDVFINDKDDKCVSPHYSGGGEFGYGPKLLGTETVAINGQTALKRNYQDTPPPRSILPEMSDQEYQKNYKPFLYSSYRFEKNGTYYTLVYNNGVTSDPAVSKDLFVSFLSTFTLK